MVSWYQGDSIMEAPDPSGDMWLLAGGKNRYLRHEA